MYLGARIWRTTIFPVALYLLAVAGLYCETQQAKTICFPALLGCRVKTGVKLPIFSNSSQNINKLKAIIEISVRRKYDETQQEATNAVV